MNPGRRGGEIYLGSTISWLERQPRKKCDALLLMQLIFHLVTREMVLVLVYNLVNED